MVPLLWPTVYPSGCIFRLSVGCIVMDRTALVTGCSSGIGRATAEAFLMEDWQLYATAREPTDLASLAENGATVAALDVTSRADAEQVIERTIAETGRLDCLVNNAGYGQFGPLEDLSAEAIRDQFDVNVLGPHRLTRAALTHMRERGTGTIVNVGSVDDRLPLAGIGAYNGSKFALAGMSAALRQEVASHGVDVVVVEPGLVATAFYDRALAELPVGDRSEAYADIYRVLESIGVFQDDILGVCEPEAVADVILEAATADSPKPRYQVGPLGKPGILVAELLPQPWRDTAVRASIAFAASAPVQRVLRWLTDRQRSQQSSQIVRTVPQRHINHCADTISYSALTNNRPSNSPPYRARSVPISVDPSCWRDKEGSPDAPSTPAVTV